MPPAARRNEHPLSMRLPAADVAIIDRAAELRGRSRTDFIREAAVQAAEQTIVETTLVRLSPGGFTAFLDALATPGTAVPELVEVLKRPAPWETEKPKPAKRRR